MSPFVLPIVKFVTPAPTSCCRSESGKKALSVLMLRLPKRRFGAAVSVVYVRILTFNITCEILSKIEATAQVRDLAIDHAIDVDAVVNTRELIVATLLQAVADGGTEIEAFQDAPVRPNRFPLSGPLTMIPPGMPAARPVLWLMMYRGTLVLLPAVVP